MTTITWETVFFYIYNQLWYWKPILNLYNIVLRFVIHRYWPICWQKLQIIVYHLIDFPLGSELPPNILTTLEFGLWVHLRPVEKFYCPQAASHMEEPELLAWECVKWCRTPMFVCVSTLKNLLKQKPLTIQVVLCCYVLTSNSSFLFHIVCEKTLPQRGWGRDQ